MQQAFRQILSFILALIVMTSTLSFSISKHYCSNILVDTAVIQPAKTCGMHDQNQDKPDKHQDEKSCCDDEVKLVEGQDELKISTIDFSLELPAEITVFSLIYVFPEIYTNKPDTIFNVYEPPEYECNLQLLHQVFLI